MKFVCDRCGKKYATAEDPAPGKVYKLRCKACGHLIVVKAQAGTSTAIPALTSAELAGAAPPEIELDVGEAVPIEHTPSPARAHAPTPLPPEVEQAIEAVAPVPSEPPLPPPPAPEKDELADFAAAAAEVIGAPAAGAAAASGYVDLFAEGAPPPAAPAPHDDPFMAAARASLPDGYGAAGGPDPFAAPPAAPHPAPEPAHTPSRAAALPKAPPPKKSGAPVALIAVGLVVLIGITAFAVMQGSKKAPAPPPPPPVAVAPAPAPEPAKPEPAPEPPKAVEPAPQPAPEPPKPKAVAKKPEPPKPKPVERKPEPPKVAAAPPPKPEPKVETREVQLPDAESALSPDVVQKVIGANRKAFTTCIAAAKGKGVTLDGRKVALRLTVNPNGAVTYPTLDDVTLNSTEMGQCLKSAARLMIFPKFKGDPFHVEVPLTLSE
ncbi:MAG TPA: AgmX/PglI C-terminal domain-containing protein [Anaeromyxobacteraceae bacterium]|nr:AgmX/PglI C-terminal domain-containing protein [Anaeromyxobacteraceae bacterium]